MELFSLKLPLIKENDDLLRIIIENIREKGKSLKEGDIIVIAEKVVATSQGRVVRLSDVTNISEKAKELAKEYDMDVSFVELIIRESSMILGGMTHVILAKVNDFLIANAGIDQSNAGEGRVVLLPKNLNKIVWDYWRDLRKEFGIRNLGVIISDSRVQPLRKGTIGIAIATAGFEPVEDLIGKPDLFNRPMEITMRAIADDLTSAAQFLLSEADQQTPVVIIRESNVEFTENPKTTPEMAPERCLYMNIFSKYLIEKNKKVE
ncbi:MAG: coenzyme F420-0:L-glutamate ligase [Promethearchaeota archaeon]|jgi:coenzyme F420-0:L-glutamate ligase